MQPKYLNRVHSVSPECKKQCFRHFTEYQQIDVIQTINGFDTKNEHDIYLQVLIQAIPVPRRCKGTVSVSEHIDGLIQRTFCLPYINDIPTLPTRRAYPEEDVPIKNEKLVDIAKCRQYIAEGERAPTTSASSINIPDSRPPTDRPHAYLDRPHSLPDRTLSTYLFIQAGGHKLFRGTGTRLKWQSQEPSRRLSTSIITLANKTFSHAGVVPDNATGRLVFSGISGSPYALAFWRYCIDHVTLIGSQDLTVKSCQNLSTLLHILFDHAQHIDTGIAEGLPGMLGIMLKIRHEPPWFVGSQVPGSKEEVGEADDTTPQRNFSHDALLPLLMHLLEILLEGIFVHNSIAAYSTSDFVVTAVLRHGKTMVHNRAMPGVMSQLELQLKVNEIHVSHLRRFCPLPLTACMNACCWPTWSEKVLHSTYWQIPFLDTKMPIILCEKTYCTSNGITHLNLLILWTVCGALPYYNKVTSHKIRYRSANRHAVRP
ncbi:hypothetical protein PR048_027767 [Dryococelus australis]|uniref:Uncharacterized protein n=1 Tax=Dryococelus australis TaxID=614101 RepID=A0ABQ9GHF9_9NEOP|nr:hypothetical protein PR048_027767 [Dryococelus australis]